MNCFWVISQDILERLGLRVLISSEEVASVDFVLDIVQDRVVTVGDDGLGLLLESREVVDDLTAEEGAAVLEGGLVDNDVGSFGFDALHDALDGALTEIVGVGFHGEAEDADGGGSLNVLTLRVGR